MTATEPTTTSVPQLMLPGQAAAPDGPVDMFTMYVMHHAFRRDLADFATAVSATPVVDVATWRALNDRWQRFGAVLHHHHHGEDEHLWPLLLERVDAAGDTAARDTLEAMEAEHEQIDPLLAACSDGLQLMASGNGTEDDRAALAVRMVATRQCLGRHLDHEERDAMAILQAHLTQEEWTATEEHAFRDGLPPRQLLFIIPWAGSGLTGPARDDVWRRQPAAFRLVYRLTRRSFRRQQARAFRYVPSVLARG